MEIVYKTEDFVKLLPSTGIIGRVALRDLDFHNGHLHVVNYARTKCDYLIVILHRNLPLIKTFLFGTTSIPSESTQTFDEKMVRLENAGVDAVLVRDWDILPEDENLKTLTLEEINRNYSELPEPVQKSLGVILYITEYTIGEGFSAPDIYFRAFKDGLLCFSYKHYLELKGRTVDHIPPLYHQHGLPYSDSEKVVFENKPKLRDVFLKIAEKKQNVRFEEIREIMPEVTDVNFYQLPVRIAGVEENVYGVEVVWPESRKIFMIVKKQSDTYISYMG